MSIFEKNTKAQIKLKPNFFLKIVDENATTLTCAKIQRKLLMFGEVGAPESFFGGAKNYMTIRPAHFMNIK